MEYVNGLLGSYIGCPFEEVLCREKQLQNGEYMKEESYLYIKIGYYNRDRHKYLLTVTRLKTFFFLIFHMYSSIESNFI